MGADAAVEEPFGPYLVYERLGVGGMATVHRALDSADPLGTLLVRNAVTAEGDTVLRFKDLPYEAALSVGSSYLQGDPKAVERVQRSSVAAGSSAASSSTSEMYQ